ncbi:MAG: hypothetical protein SGI77_07960 [Pirellulaceae bacterium]|nr:hypothetical protein [Pirellulaceae bacterium]
MPSAKSLKKLRSASTAFLEDGGSLLHGVDGLLRDIQSTLADLQRRELNLAEREQRLETRECQLDMLIQQLSDTLPNIADSEPATKHRTLAPQSIPSNAASRTIESAISDEVAEFHENLTAAAEPSKENDSPQLSPTAHASEFPGLRHSSNRKKRRL